MDPGDLAQITALVEQKLRELAPQQDRKAKARADADAYLRDLRRRDPEPSVPPVTFTDSEIRPTRLDFFTDVQQQATGGANSGSATYSYPGTDGTYALKWSSSGAVFELVKLDEIEVNDCSSGSTVTRKFLAIPVP